MTIGTDVISPIPAHFVDDVLLSRLRPPELDVESVNRLFGTLEVFPHNTPVARFGRVYHLIIDKLGGMILTQNGNIIAQGHIKEIL